MAYLTTKDFLLEVAKGKITGHTLVKRTGINPDVDSSAEEDVWSGGGNYPWRTTQSLPSVVSTSTDDIASTGTGARTIKIWGLNSSWVEVNDTITMDGTTPSIASVAMMFLDRTEILTTGAGETNAGDISVSIGGTDHAKMVTGNGEAHAAVYQIPAGKTGYLIAWSGSLYKAVSGSVEFRLMTAEDGVGWRVRNIMELTQTGAGIAHIDTHDSLIVLPAKTRIKVRAKSSADNMGVVSSFSIILV